MLERDTVAAAAADDDDESSLFGLTMMAIHLDIHEEIHHLMAG